MRDWVKNRTEEETPNTTEQVTDNEDEIVTGEVDDSISEAEANHNSESDEIAEKKRLYKNTVPSDNDTVTIERLT